MAAANGPTQYLDRINSGWTNFDIRGYIHKDKSYKYYGLIKKS